jgi:hypothetical protein
MPTLSLTRLRFRFCTTIALAASLIGLLSVAATPAAASNSQISIIQDGAQLAQNPDGTMAQFRLLGANTVRVIVNWFDVTRNPTSFKRPAHFNAADPNAYQSSKWDQYDNIVQTANKYGLMVDFTVTGGAPAWADGPGVPKGGINEDFAWKPSAKEYGLFLTAVARRYSGSFKPSGATSPLPRVHFWTIFNEPNFGEDLGPQAINGSTRSVAPMYYRRIVAAGWSALHATGHGHDTIVIGDFAARGMEGRATKRFPGGFPGAYGQTKPLEFIRTLYCLSPNYSQLRGGAAAAIGCPTTAGGSRRFRAQNPGLFNASGVGDHPYPLNLSPVRDGLSDPNFAAFPALPKLGRELDRVNRIYGSRTHYPLYNDEYGYITRPPDSAPYVSPDTAAYYMNWAEYLSWKNPRIKSYMQYLLQDPPGTGGRYSKFASGLLFPNGTQKSDFSSYRLPLYMPVTSAKRSRNLEVWGDLRPAHFYRGQTVDIQFASGSSSAFKTVKALKVNNSNGYFDLHMRFPGSGSVRLRWTYPSSDPLLLGPELGETVFSRRVALRLH